MLEQLLHQLEVQHSCKATPLKGVEEHYTLSIDPYMPVTLVDLQPGLLIYSEIALFPSKQREALLTLLMKANFLGQGTSGGRLALNAKESHIIYTFYSKADLTFQMFTEILESFYNYAEYWREQIQLQKPSIL